MALGRVVSTSMSSRSNHAARDFWCDTRYPYEVLEPAPRSSGDALEQKRSPERHGLWLSCGSSSLAGAVPAPTQWAWHWRTEHIVHIYGFTHPKRQSAKGVFMFSSKQYRTKAAEYQERGRKTDAPNEIREFKNLERTFTEMADNEEWVEQNYSKLMQHPRG